MKLFFDHRSRGSTFPLPLRHLSLLIYLRARNTLPTLLNLAGMSGLTTENVTAEPRDASQSSSAPDMANTRIPRALEMLEVLDTVMNFAENATLAACARVSSRWSALALDHLWRHMESIVPIMELISPLALPEVDDDDDEAWVSRLLVP